MSSPYVVKSTEKYWIELFAEHGIEKVELFDFEAYRNFMKRGMSPDLWLNHFVGMVVYPSDEKLAYNIRYFKSV